MRRFHSYGPVDKDIHFSVPRVALVENCLQHIIGEPGKGGHYFTIWGPRQTGKTWLMRQVKQQIENDYPDRFTVGAMSMQGVSMKESDDDVVFFSYIPLLIHRTFNLSLPEVNSWKDCLSCFYTETSGFSNPVILFIDESDTSEGQRAEPVQGTAPADGLALNGGGRTFSSVCLAQRSTR